MKKRMSFVVIVFSLLVSFKLGLEVINYSHAYSYYGSRGEQVYAIQTRLKNWGYYTGSVDGVYGPLTYRAVRYFQSKNSLRIDGIAGPQTLSALGINPNTGTNTSSVTGNRDESLLAHLIHGEARGESYTGQVAVGAVVLIRVSDSRFPKTIAGVVYQSEAFDAVSDGQINLSPSKDARKAARDALNGWDPTNGCIYYWNPITATSQWIWSRPIVTTIGKHVFAR